MNEKVLYLKSWLVSTFINLKGDKGFPFNKILVIKLDEIGDMVTALHVFYNLHNQFSNAEITTVCKPFNTIFFKYLAYVNCVTTLPKENKYFDLIVDLRGNNASLVYALKNQPKYRLDRGKIRMVNKFFGGQKNEIDTNFEIISPIISAKPILNNSIVTSEDEKNCVRSYLLENKIKNYAVIHLGARDESRRWPIERYANCIEYLNSEFSLNCLLVGGPEDNELNKQCLTKVDNSLNLNVVGAFNLLEFSELCKSAKLFLGNESGPLHIASSAKIPCIALFGPGVKNVFYPKGDKVKIHHYFLEKNHTKQTLQNSTIFKITVDEVKSSINKLLK